MWKIIKPVFTTASCLNTRTDMYSMHFNNSERELELHCTNMCTYLPFKADDFIELVKVLQTEAKQPWDCINGIRCRRFPVWPCVSVILPKHRSSWGVKSFICEEAVSCRHPWSVKTHQTIKLFQRHAHRPLGKNSNKCGSEQITNLTCNTQRSRARSYLPAD